MTSSTHARAIEVDTIETSNAGDRRTYSRYPLQIDGEVAVGNTREPCVIRDFSGTGMSLSTTTNQAIVSQGASIAADTARTWRPGETVQMTFTLPDNNARVRARAQVRRITRHGHEPRLGVAFDSANPAVFEALLKVSDRSRLSMLSHCATDQRRASLNGDVSGWDAVSCYLGDLLDTSFHRSAERLHLKAHYAAGNSSASQWYFALVAIKAVESTIRSAFVRDVVEGVYAACLGGVASETLDGLGTSTSDVESARTKLQHRLRVEVLDGLNDRAMLQLLAQRTQPLGPWIGSAPEAPITPAPLFRIFKAACLRAGLTDDNLELCLRTFREAVALHWPFTRRALQAQLRVEQTEVQPHAA